MSETSPATKPKTTSDAVKENKKTTVFGILTIIAGAIFFASVALGVDIPVVSDSSGAVAAVSAGISALLAKDGDKE